MVQVAEGWDAMTLTRFLNPVCDFKANCTPVIVRGV